MPVVETGVSHLKKIADGTERDREKLNLGLFGMLMWAQRALKGLSQRHVLVNSFGCTHEELNVRVDYNTNSLMSFSRTNFFSFITLYRAC